MNLILQQWLNVPYFDMREFRPDMYQAFIVNGKIAITFSYWCVRYHKNTQWLWQNMHKYLIVTASMIIDHCTKHEQNPLIHLRYITTNIHNFMM